MAGEPEGHAETQQDDQEIKEMNEMLLLFFLKSSFELRIQLQTRAGGG